MKKGTRRIIKKSRTNGRKRYHRRGTTFKRYLKGGDLDENQPNTKDFLDKNALNEIYLKDLKVLKDLKDLDDDKINEMATKYTTLYRNTNYSSINKPINDIEVEHKEQLRNIHNIFKKDINAKINMPVPETKSVVNRVYKTVARAVASRSRRRNDATVHTE